MTFQHGALFRFVLLYAGLFSAFGSVSPFLPAFLASRGLAPEHLGLVLGAGTTVRLVFGPFAGRLADRFHAFRAELAIFAILAATAALSYFAVGAVWMVVVVSLFQAAALAPGVSRNGVTLAAARWRRFSREQANLLSRTIALPIIVGATGLKGVRLAKRGTTPELRKTLALGIGASFVSTLASQRLIGLVERDRALWPYAAYRAALAAVVLAKLHYSKS